MAGVGPLGEAFDLDWRSPSIAASCCVLDLWKKTPQIPGFWSWEWMDNCKICLGKHTETMESLENQNFEWENSQYLWLCSRAMLNYQMVYLGICVNCNLQGKETSCTSDGIWSISHVKRNIYSASELYRRPMRWKRTTCLTPACLRGSFTTSCRVPVQSRYGFWYGNGTVSDGCGCGCGYISSTIGGSVRNSGYVWMYDVSPMCTYRYIFPSGLKL